MLKSLSVAVVALTLGACASMSDNKPTTIKLNAQNDSGQAGTAILTPIAGGKTEITVKVANPPAGVAQPVHVHEGTCANINKAPKYGLTSVMNGTSTTVIDASVATLMKTPHAINAHKSGPEAAIYVACGDIK